MVNYRVRNLDTILAQLRTAAAKVEDRVEEYKPKLHTRTSGNFAYCWMRAT